MFPEFLQCTGHRLGMMQMTMSVVLNCQCAPEGPGGLVETDGWSPAPEFLIEFGGQAQKSAFLKSSPGVDSLGTLRAIGLNSLPWP